MQDENFQAEKTGHESHRDKPNEGCHVCAGDGWTYVAGPSGDSAEPAPCYKCFPDEYKTSDLAYFERQEAAAILEAERRG